MQKNHKKHFQGHNFLKPLAPFLVIVLVVAIMTILVVARAKQQHNLTILTGNTERIAVPVVLGHYQDTQCGMTLDRLQDAAQAVAPDGRTWFFDDAGCLALWLKTNKLRDKMVLWVFTRDTQRWIDGRKAWYSRTDQTAMEYGLAAHENYQEGWVDFEQMYQFMYRGENLTNPYTRKELLGNP